MSVEKKKKCLFCDKEFTFLRQDKKYCSDNCGKKYNYKRERSSTRTCLICENDFILKSSHAINRQCCYDCMEEGKQLTRSSFAARIKEVRFDAKCCLCGYNKYPGALDFHHLDENEKDFTIGDSNFRLVEAVEEVKKCILVCSNCHREVHAGITKL